MSHPLLRGSEAPAPRTLVDILRATIDVHPDAAAADNGTSVMTYGGFADAAEDVADALRAAGVERGDRVGIRIPSGTLDLYVAIAGILVAGAAYVPVDFDDPDERARVVLGEADVAAIITTDLVVRAVGDVPTGQGDPAYAEVGGPPREDPRTDDDAWVIFTSGSTGRPKGVAVTHRYAAAFVDAESRIFRRTARSVPATGSWLVSPWLSTRHVRRCGSRGATACLVPAPRSLVRSGVELGPWVTANRISIVSTVPTLVALWPTDALAESGSSSSAGRPARPRSARGWPTSPEVWNTYGPTEATVVACGAQLTGEPPVRIGLPLAGWDLAVVDLFGQPVADGESGELVIGGVGLARYLDEAKDSVACAAMPTLGWDRAYRAGDLVRNDPAGLGVVPRGVDDCSLMGLLLSLNPPIGEGVGRVVTRECPCGAGELD